MSLPNLTIKGRISYLCEVKNWTYKGIVNKEHLFQDGTRMLSYTASEIRDLTSDLSEQDRYAHLGLRTAQVKSGGRQAFWALPIPSKQTRNQFDKWD